MLISIKADRLSSSRVGIIWGDTSLGVRKSYKVFRSAPDKDHYVLVATIDGSTSLECDDSFDRSYYRVVSDENSIEVLCENNGDPFTYAIANDNLWYLENALGSVKAKAFLIRSGQTRCPSCYNEILKKKITNDCPTCFGTGFLNAYSGPINISLAITTKAEQTDDLGVAEKESETLSVWTSHYCYFKAGDCILIGRDRYVIQDIPQESSHYTATGSLFVSRQYFVLKRMEEGYLRGIDEGLWIV